MVSPKTLDAPLDDPGNPRKTGRAIIKGDGVSGKKGLADKACALGKSRADPGPNRLDPIPRRVACCLGRLHGAPCSHHPSFRP